MKSRRMMGCPQSDEPDTSTSSNDLGASEQNFTAGVRFGSKGDMVAVLIDVRFTPKSRHWNSAA
jgi:hypothetical protein